MPNDLGRNNPEQVGNNRKKGTQQQVPLVLPEVFIEVREGFQNGAKVGVDEGANNARHDKFGSRRFGAAKIPYFCGTEFVL